MSTNKAFEEAVVPRDVPEAAPTVVVIVPAGPTNGTAPA